MHTGAATPAWRAIVTARAAKRLIEQETAADAIDPQRRQRSRDIETCVYAVDRLAARFVAGATLDDPDWRIAWTTLAYHNLCTWQRRGDATCAEQSLLMEVLEAVLTEEPAPPEMKRAGEPSTSGISISADQVDHALATACVLADNTPEVILHVLIGVALRAMSEMSRGRVRHGGPLAGPR